MTPRTAWRIGAYGPPLLLCAAAGMELAGGHVLSGVAIGCAALGMTFQGARIRNSYKIGWHDGRVDLIQQMAGNRDTGPGDRAPEPWAPRPPLGVAVRWDMPCPDEDR